MSPMQPTRYEHELEELREQRDELLVAVKGYRTALRPWLDAAIGRKGTVSYADWEIAVDRLEAAIAKAEGGPDFGPEADTHEDRGYPQRRCEHEWGINGCKKCGQPSMPRG